MRTSERRKLTIRVERRTGQTKTRCSGREWSLGREPGHRSPIGAWVELGARVTRAPAVEPASAARGGAGLLGKYGPRVAQSTWWEVVGKGGISQRFQFRPVSAQLRPICARSLRRLGSCALENLAHRAALRPFAAGAQTRADPGRVLAVPGTREPSARGCSEGRRSAQLFLSALPAAAQSVP